MQGRCGPRPRQEICLLLDISECSAISKEGSTCTISGLGNQYVPATMLGMEMNSRFPQQPGDRSRTCLLDQTRYVWNDETGVPSRTNETPLHLNEMFESLAQTRETNGTYNADLLRQNLQRSFRESGLRTKPGIQSHMPLKIYPRMRSRKHSRVRQKQRPSHQMSYLVSTLSNKVGVFSSDESSPKRILPCLSDREPACSCSGESVYSRSRGPPYTSCSRRVVYSCGAGPLYSLPGQSDADVSNQSADDDISRFCQNYSPDGGTSNCSIVGSDFILGDVSSFDSQATDWSLRTKVTAAAPNLSPHRHSLPFSSLPNTYFDDCNTVCAASASTLEHRQNLTTSNTVGSDRKYAENLSCEPFLETLPSLESRLCKIHYCTNRSTLDPLLCNSPVLHQHSSRLSMQCPKLNGIVTADTVHKQVICTGMMTTESDCFSCPTQKGADLCPEHLCASMEITCPKTVCSQGGIDQNFYSFCDMSSWDQSSDCSLQLSLLSLTDSQASFST